MSTALDCPADVHVARLALDAETVRVLRLLPGYDPLAQADGCVFDAKAAVDAVAFIEELCTHVKGAEAGKPFALEPWQKSVVMNLFGWKRMDGTRRYRECLVYVAKKNGKTALAAALVLLGLCGDGEKGAEVYSAAASRDQAALVFQHAAGMVRQETELSARLRVYGDKGGSQMRSITYDEAMSSYKCLAADAHTADGVNPHFAIVDELHRHKSPELAEVLQKSTAARKQPLVIYTTTADYNRPSLCNTKLAYARSVRDNPGDPAQPGFDASFLPVVYECAKDDDWTSPETWRKANPNLGVTVSEEFLARECKKAQESPTELNNFLRLHLNIVTDTDEAWIAVQDWDAASGLNEKESPEAWRERILAEMQGRECFLGMDLSSKVDLTAVVQIFRPEATGQPWVFVPYFWVPAENAHEKERRDHVPYTTWERMGFVRMTEGNEIDSQSIRRFIGDLDKKYPVREIGYDEWNATELSRQLREEDGFGERLVAVRQGAITLSDPMKEVEAMAKSKRIQHGGNPVFRWMIGNLCVKQDENGNLRPNKKTSTGRIDGPVALFSGMARALTAPLNLGSVYETRGIETI